MRAPGEAPGLMALEIAMDEMAEKLGLDPVAFRILNDTQVDPQKPDRPFSHRDLIGCLKLGAERFGWDKRNPRPGQVRDGRWLVGLGMAAGFRNNLLTKSGARVRLGRDGIVTVETDMTDIGTGTYTIIAPDRGRDDGRAAREGRRAARRFRLPGLGRVGRAVGRQQLDRRRLCGLRQAARGRGAEARVQLRPTRSSRTARSARATAARALADAARDGDLIGRGPDRVRRPRQDAPAIDLRGPLRRGGGRLGNRRRHGCGACSRCARPAASSTRSRPAAR